MKSRAVTEGMTQWYLIPLINLGNPETCFLHKHNRRHVATERSPRAATLQQGRRQDVDDHLGKQLFEMKVDMTQFTASPSDLEISHRHHQQ